MLTLEQRKERKKGIGGSDAAAICGLSKWKTPVDIYLDKINENIIEEEPRDEFDRGNALESFVLGLFSNKIGKEVKIKKEPIKSEKNDFMFANIDGILEEEKALVEFKTSNYSNKQEWEEIFSDKVPNDYLIQCHHYMNVVPNIEKVYIPVLFGSENLLNMTVIMVNHLGVKPTLEMFHDFDFNLKIYEVKKHLNLGKKIEEIEQDFWINNVQKKVPPMWKKREDLINLFPEATEKEVIARQDDIEIISEINKKKKEMEEIEKEIEERKIYLCGRMKDASILKTPEGSILATWKNQERKTFDVKKFSKKNPLLANEFYNTKIHRVLRIGE